MDNSPEIRIVYLPIDRLTPYGRNAKLHPPEQIAQIRRSIADNGMIDPVGIWGPDNEIVEGHGRVIACRELGVTLIPCIRLDHLTDEQRRAYALVHNQTTLTSGFDPELLRLEIGDLPGLDPAAFGFELPAPEAQALDLDDAGDAAQGGDGITCHCPKCGFIFEVRK